MMIPTQSVDAIESVMPVLVDYIDDVQGIAISIYRDLDEEGPDGEHFLVMLTPENAKRLGKILIAAAKGRGAKP